jgi:heat shock protein HslJ
MVSMKNRKIYVSIGVVVVVVLVAIWAFSYFSKANVAARENRIISSGISEIQGQPTSETSASTSAAVVGTGTTLGVRTVSERAAYARIQSEWIWVKTTYSNPSFAPSGPTKGKDFVLSLNEDKSISVAGDCNAIKGSYTLDKNTVSALETEDEMALGDMKVKASAMTKKACEFSKENSFITDLEKVSSYDMRTNLLSLTLANGQGYMVFRRNLEVEG